MDEKNIEKIESASVSIEYDTSTDTFYLSVGKQNPDFYNEDPEGTIVRFDEDGNFQGVTIFDFKQTYLK